ncbi:type II secretion system F family protein [Streptomyces sp. NPDC015127]|uniref:type II secretion system F family protein n=1 Tax=Streptomyces sp. NPDC015127 TaxID=3364939 RepID=UPI0036F78168
MSPDVVHRLGAVLAGLAAVSCVGSLIAAHRRGRAVRGRIEALLSVEREQRRSRAELVARAKTWAAPFGAAAVCYVLLGGVVGAVAAIAAGFGVRHWFRRRERAAATMAEKLGIGGGNETARQLPLAADLLAACISAGAGPREAAEAVGESLGGQLGERLARAAAELRLGGEPAHAWGWFAATAGAGPLARCLERADLTGAPAAEQVARLAERLRADRAREVAAQGRKAQVLITAPVGLCFLPAFLAVGVAPVVIGLAGGLLSGD